MKIPRKPKHIERFSNATLLIVLGAIAQPLGSCAIAVTPETIARDTGLPFDVVTQYISGLDDLEAVEVRRHRTRTTAVRITPFGSELMQSESSQCRADL